MGILHASIRGLKVLNQTLTAPDVPSQNQYRTTTSLDQTAPSTARQPRKPRIKPQGTLPSSTNETQEEPLLVATTTEVRPILGMNKWEGRIIEIEDGLFSAELTPLDHEGPTLVADFDLKLLAPDDTLVRPGDVVYLTVRTVREFGYVTTTSGLRLRRVARWSESELNAAWRAGQQESRALQEYAS
jgi:hypothetical protein